MAHGDRTNARADRHAEAAERLGAWVNHTLAGLPEPASVTVGLAELHAGDTAEISSRAPTTRCTSSAC